MNKVAFRGGLLIDGTGTGVSEKYQYGSVCGHADYRYIRAYGTHEFLLWGHKPYHAGDGA